MRWLEDVVVFMLGAAIVILAVCFIGSVVVTMISFVFSLVGIFFTYLIPFAVVIGVAYLIERIL